MMQTRRGAILDIEPGTTLANWMELFLTEHVPDCPESAVEELVAELASQLDTADLIGGPRPEIDWEPSSEDQRLGLIEAAL